MKQGGLYVGDAGKRQRPARISDDERRLHMHIIGATGTGKSKGMEHMIREDILARKGLCLIDPTGALYDEIVRWLVTRGIKRKIIFFNPASDKWAVGYNPLRRTSKDISHQRDAMANAIVRVWGADNLAETPSIKRGLRNIIEMILVKKMSLLDSRYLFYQEEKEKREYLIKDIDDPILRAEWVRYGKMSKYEWEKELLGPGNRLHEFISSPRIRRILGQLHNSMDMRTIMDEGWILLVNLSLGKSLSEESAKTLGTLLIHDFFLTATERDLKTAKKKPFYLYIDECQDYINEDIGRILDQCRKFGLHAILAHQHMAQLEGERLHDSLMASARNKLIFGGLPPKSVDELVDYCYAGEFSPYAIKKVIETIREKHTKIREKTYSSGDSFSKTIGESWAEIISEHLGEALSEVMLPGLDGEVIRQSQTGQKGTSRATAVGGFKAEAKGHSEGVGDVPGWEIEEEKQIANIIYKTLEEQKYEAKSLMANNPTRYGVLKRPDKPPVVIKVPMIKDGFANDARVKEYEDKYLELCGVARRVEDVNEELEARERELGEAVEEWKKEEEGPKEPEDYYEQHEGPEEPEDFYE